MAGDVEKREVSTGGNGREAESERVIPGRVIISTTQRQDVMLSGGLSRLNEWFYGLDSGVGHLV
jgi:hypothetical protein